MFLQLPFKFNASVKNTVLIINTVILLALLIAIEIFYSEKPKSQRKELKYLFPVILVLVGILIYAGVKQVGKG